MKTKFDWQTEENSELEQEELAEIKPPSRRRLGCLVMMLAVSAVFISSFVWLINRRQSEALTNVSENVLLAFELQQQAAGNDDKELFSATLSSSDPAWKHDQEQLLAESLFDGRSNMGLVGDPESGIQTTIDLSPDLNKAEVTYAQVYTSVASLTETANLELLHTLVYRLEDGRWLNAPRDLSYWGPWDEINGALFSITYPQRDAELAKKLAEKIDDDLTGLCAGLEEQNDYGLAYCEGYAPWQIRLSTNVESLLDFAETSIAHSSEFDYELPAPSVVGIPRNENEYETYLEIYSRPLLHKMEVALSSTAPYPKQDIYALCFDHPLSGRHLYRFDRRKRSWRPILPAQEFNHLSAFPDDSAIMLVDDNALTVVNVKGHSDSTGHAQIWQGNLSTPDAPSLVGWIESADALYHLVQHSASDTGLPAYSALNLRDCGVETCVPTDLPGFPVPSRSSDASLYLMGSEIVIGYGQNEETQSVGRGFSPFWVDKNSFGFVRFTSDTGAGITTQVVLGERDNADLQVLFDGNDLAREAAIPWESVLYVNEVISNPANPDLLLISSTGIRDYSGNYYVFSANVSERRNQPLQPALKLEMARTGTLGGVPGLLSPTGPPSFLVSADGRWLAMTELNSQDRETWTIVVHDLKRGTTSPVSNSVPAMPGNFPLLDWSNDGQWLLVADRSTIHLVAPEHEHQEVVTHDFDACSHIVWAD